MLIKTGKRELSRMSVSSTGSPGKGGGRYFIFGAAFVASLVIGMSLLGGLLQVEIQPYHFLFFSVGYSEAEGGYRVSFALLDDGMVNGPSNGYVTLRILEAGGSPIYQNTFVVRARDFSSTNNPLNGEAAIGYAFAVPLANLTNWPSANMSALRFQITFLSMAGRSVTSETTIFG